RYGDFADPQSSVYDSAAYTETGQGRMGRPPWEDPARYVRNSPISAVDRVTTPLLMIHGDGDLIPLQQAEEFYAALYRQNKRACLVRYTGEGHLIEGEANVLDVWRRMYGWLSEFLDSPNEPASGPAAPI
ncbi:MAG: prolyl oligopeptidase family serine peptidase, partial [Chloroflexi bacterium]|nr:prolyl oligopeptidase family serine peptidase [Chloroflexota bacterium]